MNSSLDAASLHAEIAAELRRAEKLVIPIAPPTSFAPSLDADAAYEVQRFNITARVAAGERIVGRKIGLTSEAIQRQLGVDQPDYGVITNEMVIPDGGVLDVTRLVAPRVEAEFAFLIGYDVPVSPTPEELVRAVEGVGVAIEIIDSRVADWKITLADTIADNASSARIVHGEFRAAFRERLESLPATEISLTRNGEVVSVGPGSAVLGDPLISLHWLATAIGAHEDHFRAGDVVLAGAVSAAVPLIAGAEWSASAEGFEPVAFTTV